MVALIAPRWPGSSMASMPLLHKYILVQKVQPTKNHLYLRNEIPSFIQDKLFKSLSNR